MRTLARRRHYYKHSKQNTAYIVYFNECSVFVFVAYFNRFYSVFVSKKICLNATQNYKHSIQNTAHVVYSSQVNIVCFRPIDNASPSWEHQLVISPSIPYKMQRMKCIPTKFILYVSNHSNNSTKIQQIYCISTISVVYL